MRPASGCSRPPSRRRASTCRSRSGRRRRSGRRVRRAARCARAPLGRHSSSRCRGRAGSPARALLLRSEGRKDAGMRPRGPAWLEPGGSPLRLAAATLPRRWPFRRERRQRPAETSVAHSTRSRRLASTPARSAARRSARTASARPAAPTRAVRSSRSGSVAEKLSQNERLSRRTWSAALRRPRSRPYACICALPVSLHRTRRSRPDQRASFCDSLNSPGCRVSPSMRSVATTRRARSSWGRSTPRPTGSTSCCTGRAGSTRWACSWSRRATASTWRRSPRKPCGRSPTRASLRPSARLRMAMPTRLSPRGTAARCSPPACCTCDG